MNKEELKLLRRHLGYTQDQMAEAVGKSRAQYARYEAGKDIDKSVLIILKGLNQTVQT